MSCRGQETATEQQHTSTFGKEFVIYLLNGRITELESQLKQKEMVNDFLISTFNSSSTIFINKTTKRLLNETLNGSKIPTLNHCHKSLKKTQQLKSK